MSTFFSGTDLSTLKTEGRDNNHFVSLIVNNDGKYSAAITKRIESKFTGTKESSYKSFDDELVSEDTVNVEGIDSVIEYYPLNIIMPSPSPKSELDIRLEEVKKNSNSYINRKKAPSTPYVPNTSDPSKYDPYLPYASYIPAYENPYTKEETPVKEVIEDLTKSKPAATQLSMFTDEEMGKEAVVVDETEIDYDKVHVDPKMVKDSVTQIITGDIFSIYKTNIDLDKWGANMESLYSKRFGDAKSEDFKYWVDNLTDFLVCEAEDVNLLEKGEDYTWAIWAYDVIEELKNYPSNKYLDAFINSLSRWLI